MDYSPGELFVHRLQTGRMKVVDRPYNKRDVEVRSRDTVCLRTSLRAEAADSTGRILIIAQGRDVGAREVSPADLLACTGCSTGSYRRHNRFAILWTNGLVNLVSFWVYYSG